MSTTNYTRERCDVCGREEDVPQGKRMFVPLRMVTYRSYQTLILDESMDVCSAACAARGLDLLVGHVKAKAKLIPPSEPLRLVAPSDYTKGERA